MSRYDEPTQRVRAPQPPPAPLPGSLDPLRGHQTETGTGWIERDDDVDTAADATGVLPLDEIFESAAPAAPTAATQPTAAAEAPTWTAMPVVPVRSEPMTAAPAAPAPPAPARSAPAHPPLTDRVRTDATAAWDGAVRRTRAWLGRDDNALMLLTALVAVILILAVAAFAR